MPTAHGNPSNEDAGVRELKQKLSDEERAYAELLAELDSLADANLPYRIDPELPSQIERLNNSWEVQAVSAPSTPATPATLGGIKGLARRWVRRLLDPELSSVRESLARQQTFNSLTVQFLNRYLEAANRHSLRLQ
jgi:hypothetical protein